MRIRIAATITFILMLVSISLQVSAQESSGDEPKKAAKTQKTKEKTKEESLSFKKDVFPIIKKYCMPCHAEEQMNPSELFMDSYETIAAGGKRGKAFIPGKADSSLLIIKLGAKPPFGDRMPLKAKQPLPDEFIKTISLWIDQGAKKN